MLFLLVLSHAALGSNAGFALNGFIGAFPHPVREFGVVGPTELHGENERLRRENEELLRTNRNLEVQLQRCMESAIPRYSIISFVRRLSFLFSLLLSASPSFGTVRHPLLLEIPTISVFRQFPAFPSFGISVFGSFCISFFGFLDPSPSFQHLPAPPASHLLSYRAFFSKGCAPTTQ